MRSSKFILFGIVMVILVSCSKDEPQNLPPTVGAMAATDITRNSATLNGFDHNGVPAATDNNPFQKYKTPAESQTPALQTERRRQRRSPRSASHHVPSLTFDDTNHRKPTVPACHKGGKTLTVTIDPGKIERKILKDKRRREHIANLQF